MGLNNNVLTTYCNVAILPMVAKDLSISARFSPTTTFYPEASSALLHLGHEPIISDSFLIAHALTLSATYYRSQNQRPYFVKNQLTTPQYLFILILVFRIVKVQRLPLLHSGDNTNSSIV